MITLPCRHHHYHTWSRLPGDVTCRTSPPRAATDALCGVLLARLLQLGTESNHLHHLQPRL